MTSAEVLSVAMAAKAVYQLNSYVSWCQAALDVAKNEGKSQQIITKIRKMISNGKKDHDEEILHYGYFRAMIPTDPETIVQVNEMPYNKVLLKSQEWQRYYQRRKNMEEKMEPFDNLVTFEHR